MMRPLIVALIACGIPTASLAASFHGLGVLPGYDYSEAVGVSADGSVVAANNRQIANFGQAEQASTWTAATGMVGLGYLPSQNFSRALGVSADGSAIVGYGQALNSGTGAKTFRWTAPTGMVALGDIPGGNNNNFANAANANGSAVAGSGVVGCCGQAYRWTAPTGMVSLGVLPGAIGGTATGVNADGSVVVGYGYNNFDPNFRTQAFRWTSQTGPVGIGFLPNALASYAYGVSADGSVVVGYNQRFGDIKDEAFRWTATTGQIGLGFLSGGTFSQANAVNADGSVIVGLANTDSGPDGAFIWTTGAGMRSIKDLLVAQGDWVSGWLLFGATGVSANGTVIVGTGINPFGQTEAWIADLSATATPLPAALPLFATGLGVIGLLGWRRKNRLGGKIK